MIAKKRKVENRKTGKTDIQDDADIKKLVHRFYDKVGQDERLGYMFNDVAQVNWKTHLPKMVNFWSNILFKTRRFKGRPYRKHRPLPIKRADFNIWLGLWNETVDHLYEGQNADIVKEVAYRVACAFTTRLEMDNAFVD